jgi:hypothetical protein
MTRLEHFDLMIESAQPPPVPDARKVKPGCSLAHLNLPELAGLLALVLQLAAERPQPWRPRTIQERLT